MANGGPAETATVAVTVAAVADARPNHAAAATEDTPFSGNLAANDTFSGATAYALATAPAHGTAVVHADGSFTYAPAADYNGSDSFTYSVANGGPAETATVAVTVAAVADAVNDAAAATEDTPFSGNLAANDTFSGATAYALATAPAHGTAVVDADAASPTRPAATTTAATRSPTRWPTAGRPSAATVAVTVAAVADAVNDAAAATEDTPFSGNLAANDTFSGATAYALATAPAHGTAVVHADGSFTYAPAPTTTAADCFTYRGQRRAGRRNRHGGGHGRRGGERGRTTRGRDGGHPVQRQPGWPTTRSTGRRPTLVDRPGPRRGDAQRRRQLHLHPGRRLQRQPTASPTVANDGPADDRHGGGHRSPRWRTPVPTTAAARRRHPFSGNLAGQRHDVDGAMAYALVYRPGHGTRWS